MSYPVYISTITQVTKKPLVTQDNVTIPANSKIQILPKTVAEAVEVSGDKTLDVFLKNVVLKDDLASTESDGLMSKEDKARLDSLPANANEFYPSGGTVGQILVKTNDGVEWKDEYSVSFSTATQDDDGLMSSLDKAKLDNINLTNYVSKIELPDLLTLTPIIKTLDSLPTVGQEGFLYYTPSADPNIFEGHVWNGSEYKSISSTTITASSFLNKADGITNLSFSGDTVTLTKGDNSTVAVNFPTYAEVNADNPGLMSVEDKYKLDQLSASGSSISNLTITPDLDTGTKIATIRLNEDDIELYAPDEAQTYGVASSTTDGLLSSEDKIKLDGIKEWNSLHNKYINVTGNVIDLSLGTVFVKNLTKNTVLEFNNLPSQGEYKKVTVVLKNAQTYTVTWPDAILWNNGSTPEITSDVFVIDFIFVNDDIVVTG